ncbi:ribbon-helix-helix protein, CopG family [Altericroceibacterium spongiae]|uniref:Ribbon-helix-helix protein, CopG family n=2 Tax=Altericroceibacterium spongiae TaxID=2320269 RepID=A0A420EAM6_9SPHN|nr:ribbon-helix-helix protein, CopG family [Altericroceibacterium spongiae]
MEFGFMKNTKRIQITLRLDPQTMREIEALCRENEQSVSDVCRSLINAGLPFYKNKTGVDLSRVLLLLETIYLAMTLHLQEDEPELFARIDKLARSHVDEHHA